MPFKFHPDASGSKVVPHLDAAVVCHRSEKVRISRTKGGVRDSIRIVEQLLILPAGKVLEGERLLVVEE